MKSVTLENIYKKVINQIKRSLFEEPELREDFILRMKAIDLEKSIAVKDFGKRYGLKQCIHLPLKKTWTRNLRSPLDTCSN